MRSQSEASKGRARDSSGRVRIAFWVPLGVTLLTLGVFAGAILMMTAQVRKQLHAGILREDADVLLAALTAGEPAAPGESEQDRLERVLKASDFRGNDVFGARLFDGQGQFLRGLDKDLKPTDLTPEELAAVRRGEVFGRFEPAMNLADEFQNGGITAVGPVLKATIPVDDGAAQYLLSAERVHAKLLAMKRDVRLYAMSMLAIGASVIGLGLAWAFRRLNRANRLLEERTANLLRANHELALAAKTSAVGAVAAHLIHGLKNPLTGLQLLVSNQLDEPNTQGAEWRIAAEAARRMQVMIADIVRILQEDAGDNYEISAAEMLELLQAKMAPLAKEKGVRVTSSSKLKGRLANREANLVILAISNLIQNAIQASPAGKRVQIEAGMIGDAICFDVADEAGGIPESVRPYLFTPCHSTKPGGTGIGLAITKQLVSHMGGQLELVETNEQGTRIRLSIPATVFLNDRAESARIETSAMA